MMCLSVQVVEREMLMLFTLLMHSQLSARELGIQELSRVMPPKVGVLYWITEVVDQWEVENMVNEVGSRPKCKAE
jgi:hypothetical protein